MQKTFQGFLFHAWIFLIYHAFVSQDDLRRANRDLNKGKDEMKNLTSKIGKYLSELATQLLKVLWSDDLRLEFLLVRFDLFSKLAIC